MSAANSPIDRPLGNALIVAGPACQREPMSILSRLGIQSAEADDPYSAMLELSLHPQQYHSLILSLAGLYREELELISVVKNRLPHVDIWLIHTDGRQATLAEALRLGADGLLAEDGPHRTSAAAPAIPRPEIIQPTEDNPPPPPAPPRQIPDEPAPSIHRETVLAVSDPVLSADELRALLQEQPSLPAGGEE